MASYKVKCESIEISGDAEVCPGSAKCLRGETYILTARTPEPLGMCARAFSTIHPMAFALRWSERMEWEKADHVDVICPDGFVTYRLSRIKD